VQARFSAKAMQAMRAKMLEGSTAKGKKVREARDFEDDFEQAKHISTEGWPGKARHGEARQAWRGMAGLGTARQGRRGSE
jgi:hypothetical protein